MKFAHKMICLLVLVLSASFGLGGCWLLYSDFCRAAPYRSDR